MSSAWRLIAEDRINEATQNGEFDELPGKGQPLDLTEYFNTPAEDRVAFSILKNAGVIPPEMELLREVEALERRVERCSDASQAAQLRELIRSKRVKLSMALERRSNVARRQDV